MISPYQKKFIRRRPVIETLMRLSEKTLELNFSKGFPGVIGLNLLWLGLTQDEERHLGFDLCTNAGGMLIAIQMKRFKKTLKKSGARRFDAPHHQMYALKHLDIILQKAGIPRFVAYAVPDASESTQLCGIDCPSFCVNYLDLAQFPPTIPPSGRNSGLHYVDVIGSAAIVHSEEFEVPVIRSGSLRESLDRSERIQPHTEVPDLAVDVPRYILNSLGRRVAFGVAV